MENNQPLFSYGTTSAGLFSKGEFQYHFNPDGFYNDKNSWISDDLAVKIIWDTTLNAWKLSGTTLGTTQVINQNPNYPPINGDWRVVGANYTSTAKQGECPPINTLTSKVEFNNPGCVCDGSINVTATGGVPPYMYSYNGGSTYVSSPILTNVCGGIYNVKIKDSENTIVTKTITISDVVPTVNRTTKITQLSKRNLTSTSIEYTYGIVVDPPLTPGIQITFDLNFTGTFRQSPLNSLTTSTNTPNVKKNNNTITYSQNNTTITNNYNDLPGCQTTLVKLTNYSYVYKSLTITNTDVYTISVITDYNLDCSRSLYELPYENNSVVNELGPLTYPGYVTTTTTLPPANCCIGEFSEPPTCNMSNQSINGCNCCTVTTTNFWNYYYNRS